MIGNSIGEVLFISMFYDFRLLSRGDYGLSFIVNALCKSVSLLDFINLVNAICKSLLYFV